MLPYLLAPARPPMLDYPAPGPQTKAWTDPKSVAVTMVVESGAMLESRAISEDPNRFMPSAVAFQVTVKP